jgi:hypothetical protein
LVLSMSATYICRECGEDVPVGGVHCGFGERLEFDARDPRHVDARDRTVELPPDVEAVRFVDSLGAVTFRRGPRPALAAALRAAGYRVTP